MVNWLRQAKNESCAAFMLAVTMVPFCEGASLLLAEIAPLVCYLPLLWNLNLSTVKAHGQVNASAAAFTSVSHIYFRGKIPAAYGALLSFASACRRGNGENSGKNPHGPDQDRGSPFPLQLYDSRGGCDQITPDCYPPLVEMELQLLDTNKERASVAGLYSSSCQVFREKLIRPPWPPSC